MIKKCLYPVAGSGTRFLPITKSIAKEMLPILATPLLQYGVEEAISAGMNSQIMVVNKEKESSIKDYFSAKEKLDNLLQGTAKSKQLQTINAIVKNCDFSYTYQTQAKGLGDAIAMGEKLVDDEAFAVILPDDLCVNDDDSVLQQMIKIYNKYKCSIVAIEEVPKNEVDKYGIIVGEQIEEDIYQISDMIEKPSPEQAPTNLAIIGRYILTTDIFKIIKNTAVGKGGEVQITDALLTLAKNKKVLAYKFKGLRFDCGSVDGFVDATNYFYNKNK